MKIAQLKSKLEKILSLAGIDINGNNPWDIKVHNEKFYQRVLAEGSLGLGESYMDEWWDCEKLDEFFYRALSANLRDKIKIHDVLLQGLKAKVLKRFTNSQSIKNSKRVARIHYDLGNDLYKSMLGKYMQYTCCYWNEGDDLNTAEENKLELICQKLKLEPGMRVLETGCGFGGFARYAASKHGVSVVGVNISREQVVFARDFCKGLDVEIIEGDYRDINRKTHGVFDRGVAIGIREHIGSANYRDSYERMFDLLSDDGLFLDHTIGKTKSVKTDPWFDKYLFPGGELPLLSQLTKASKGLFVKEDTHNIRAHYDKTLMAWHERFSRSWPQLEPKYGKLVGGKFKRMWDYYLLSCAGSFRSGNNNQLWQIVYSKGRVKGGYESVR